MTALYNKILYRLLSNCQSMSNGQNSEENCFLLLDAGSYIFHQNHFDHISNSSLPQNQTELQSPDRSNNLYANAFMDIGTDSLKTINHGSLQMVPELCPMELNSEGKSELPILSMKSSNNSLIFMEQLLDDDEQQDRLVTQTSKLNLKSSIEDHITNRFIHKTPKRNQFMINRKKGPLIKKIRILIRELKREVKYNDKIMADVFMHGENFKHRLNHAIIQPITDQKGHLSGLIVFKDQKQYKIRVINAGVSGYEPIVQLWDEQKQAWLQFQFIIKLLQ